MDVEKEAKDAASNDQPTINQGMTDDDDGIIS
jgi:hypothetical protein